MVNGPYPHYDYTFSDQYLSEHNEFEFGDDPNDEAGSIYAWLMPLTQCGYADTYIKTRLKTLKGIEYTGKDFKGRYWQTRFQPQNLVKPKSLCPLPVQGHIGTGKWKKTR